MAELIHLRDRNCRLLVNVFARYRHVKRQCRQSRREIVVQIVADSSALLLPGEYKLLAGILKILRQPSHSLQHIRIVHNRPGLLKQHFQEDMVLRRERFAS
ncbi:hypothetical protein D3C85_1552280 [compost metagenome]